MRKATPLLKPSRLSHKQSSLSKSSPRRLAQTARMTISRSKKAVQQLQAAQIGVSPNVMSMGTMLPTLASQCMNPMTASIPQQSSMNLFLNENPVLLQSSTCFLAPTTKNFQVFCRRTRWPPRQPSSPRPRSFWVRIPSYYLELH